MSEIAAKDMLVYRYPAWAWLLFAAIVMVLSLPFYDALSQMVSKWLGTDEYSHAIVLPFVAAFLLWCQKDELSRRRMVGSWLGPILVLVGFGAQTLGELATLYTIVQYAYLVVIAGLVLSLSGIRLFPKFIPALVILFFTVPLPNFLYNNLSSELQLISSQLGVWFIRLFGIPVYLQGNVIDLGSMKLQVVEACSGLNYLFPLLSIGFIAAYIFKAPLWQRVLIFLSIAPITVVMNSVRIGIIGLSVDRYGSMLTEGFLHFFEGWVVFMVSLAILFAEIWLFNVVFNRRQSFAQVFAIELPGKGTPGDGLPRSVPLPFKISAGIVFTLSFAALALPDREESIPTRLHFTTYPLFLGEWTGQRRVMESVYVDALKFDDYILADYSNGAGALINFYTAYYSSQRKGQSAHSPRSCIPGGGWRIESLQTFELPFSSADGSVFNANRVLIAKGENKQLVYYWFQQRGRNITNEYLVKWYMFVDALSSNRTDGALVRFTTPVRPGEDLQGREAQLTSFMMLHHETLRQYIPE